MAEWCYSANLPSSLSAHLIDNDDDGIGVQNLEIGGVQGYLVKNNTGRPLTLEWLQGQKPQWKWKLISSVNAFITIPEHEPLTQEPVPVYFKGRIKHDQRDADEYGRYTSHPGYKNSNWSPLANQDNKYQQEWVNAKHADIPRDSRKKYVNGVTGDLYLDIPDENWIPPPWFANHIQRKPGQSYT